MYIYSINGTSNLQSTLATYITIQHIEKVFQQESEKDCSKPQQLQLSCMNYSIECQRT